MSHLYDDDEYSTFCMVYFDIIVPSLIIISLIMMVPAFYKYIKMFKSKEVKQCLYWSSLIFFIIIFISMIAVLLSSIYFCRYSEKYKITISIYSQSYVIQSLLLLAILFARLYFVFKKSSFALSKLTIKLYSILYSLTIIVLFGVSIGYSNFKGVFELIAVGFALLLFILLMVILVVLFLYKMTQVYKYVNITNDENNDNDEGLIGIITKTSILGINSIFATVLNGIFFAIAVSTENIHLQMLHRLLTVFDVTTNFWCIILSYRVYNEWYLKICGYCDSKCAICWHKITQTKSDEMANVINL